MAANNDSRRLGKQQLLADERGEIFHSTLESGAERQQQSLSMVSSSADGLAGCRWEASYKGSIIAPSDSPTHGGR